MHVGVFHLPKLEEVNNCDVQECNFIVGSRIEHVEHISYHTEGDDALFLRGLEKLHKHYSDSRVWEVVKTVERRELDFQSCPLCQCDVSQHYELLLHLTTVHFREAIARNLPPEKQEHCTFSRCGLLHRTSNECVLHLGVYHGLSAQLVKFAVDTATNIPCPYSSCKKTTDSLDAVVRHMISSHCHDGLANEIKRLQEIKGYDNSRWCPFKDCTFSSAVSGSLITHYGVQHGAAMDIVLSQSDVVKRGALVKVIQVLYH